MNKRRFTRYRFGQHTVRVRKIKLSKGTCFPTSGSEFTFYNSNLRDDAVK